MAAKAGKKPAAKPSGPSKFAAFRAKMLQQKKEEEERKKEEQQKEEQQKEEQKEQKEERIEEVTAAALESPDKPENESEEGMKSFDAGFFKVCSPLKNSPLLQSAGMLIRLLLLYFVGGKKVPNFTMVTEKSRHFMELIGH